MMSGEQTTYTLSQVAKAIQRTLQSHASQSFWIRAEMNTLGKSSTSDHAYPELIEHRGGEIIARMKGVIWKTDFSRIQENFTRIVGEPLKGQLQVMVLGKVEYHPVYGLTLRITDLDPRFTLGELQQKKREILERLQREGLLLKNQQLQTGRWFKRIAVITAESSDGWRDFQTVLARHPLGSRIQTLTFESIMQGDHAPFAIMSQLQRIQRVQEHFDAVAILRGGGGELSLLCYDDEQLARTIAHFPLPVLTGIGHSTNLTVAENVAHHHCITPTDLANYFIGKIEADEWALRETMQTFQKCAQNLLQENSNALQQLIVQVHHTTTTTMNRAKTAWDKLTTSLPHIARRELTNQRQMIDSTQQSIKQWTSEGIQHRRHSLQHDTAALKSNTERQIQETHHLHRTAQSEIMMRWNLELEKNKIRLNGLATAMTLLDPKNTLKRGYSITRYDGKAITDPMIIPDDATIVTTTYNGTFTSKKIKES